MTDFLKEKVSIPDVRYKVAKGFLFCRLPSGRCLAYASPFLATKDVYYFKIHEGEFPRSIVYNKNVHGGIPSFEALADKYDAEVKKLSTSQIRFFGVNPTTKQWSRQHTYGGSLAENVTQAVARDLLAHSMVNAEAAGYPIVLHVHDELVADVPEGKGSLDGLRNIMLRSPDWAQGLPLDAAGCEAKRFKK